MRSNRFKKRKKSRKSIRKFSGVYPFHLMKHDETSPYFTPVSAPVPFTPVSAPFPTPISFDEFIILPPDQQAVVFIQQTPENQTHLVTRIGETTGIRPLTVLEWKSIQSSPQYHMTLSTTFWELSMNQSIFLSNQATLDDYMDRDDSIDRLQGNRDRKYARLDVFYWKEIPYHFHSMQYMVNKDQWLETHVSSKEVEQSQRAGRGGGRFSLLDRYKESLPSLHASIHEKLQHVDILLTNSRDKEYYTFVRRPRECLTWKLLRSKHISLTTVLVLNYIFHQGLPIKPWARLVDSADRGRIKTIATKEESTEIIGHMFKTLDELDILGSGNRNQKELAHMLYHHKKQIESVIAKVMTPSTREIESWIEHSEYDKNDGLFQCLINVFFSEMYRRDLL